MPIARLDGVRLHYDTYGAGEPVVMVTGTGAPGRMWRTHQVPALTAAGHRVVTLDNRGIPPSDPCADGFTLADMAADVAALIESLGEGACRVVGYSLGAIAVQELLLARPELIRAAVLMATSGRTDALTAAMTAADLELVEGAGKLPPRFAAYVRALQNLSPRTLNDEERLRDWLAVFEMTAVDRSEIRGQLGLQLIPDRLAAYRLIDVPCLVIGFQDDLVVRPHLSREVADALPNSTYAELPGCGHYGYLERPAAVNAAITDFFAAAGP
ncbi:alpha/beta hydrolase [Streptomyces alfalfae]|uniref:Alpha/beta hydrolase n=1 Tax=Streptomyces alfalfae TaxID=1642299 RepID=A0ABM6GN17_9ACTN|nr:alpha/beta hydrolase [Streptomyces alfalfae]APY85023.1 alpha/beta hydrolase [Streptomyces alfalfae]AYA15360.1 alpha/beta hydrolase [Streptomyces fradiae]RXX47399.1 alpha/beta hydrolase [Streptomyces alfalfae]RZM91942.1 alpha/beta hydrolase [Streptomyces alfalfae]